MRKANRKMQLKKRVVANAAYLDNAIANSQPTTTTEITRIMTVIRLCYEKLKIGNAERREWIVVADCINIGLVRAEAIDPAVVEMFNAAGQAIVECEQIYLRHGKYGFTGPHILTMNAALEFYEQIITLSTPNQMYAAGLEADRRIKAGEVVPA